MKSISKLQLFSLAGILGSLLMFSGDMLLYFHLVSGADYNSVPIMSKMPINRIIAGGLMGPIAGAFSVLGGYLFYLVFKSINRFLAAFMFIFFALMFIASGSYHAVFASLGLVGRLPEPHQAEQLLFLKTYLKSIYSFIFACGLIWTLLLFYLVIFTKTIYPKWMLFFTPTLLLLLSPYFKDLIPYPLGGILYGGSINLIFMLYFTVCFIALRKESY